MKYENFYKLRLEHISGEIKETVESAYSKGYTDGREEEKRKNANDLEDPTVVHLKRIETWLKSLFVQLEIVYCKDCEQCKQIEPNYLKALGGNFIGKKHCDKFDIIVSDDDYCSFGKRKEDETR